MNQIKNHKELIINDPLYGFITIKEPILIRLINHRFFQRLRRISQMGLASFVFPGATHSRFVHSLGCLHLLQTALQKLKNDGYSISSEENMATQIAMLLHDIGHGPFSHSLEFHFLNHSHEKITLALLQELNTEFNGELSLAIEIYKNNYHQKYLHQLINSQLDMDRLDYLRRDGFFSGIEENVVSYQRLITMLEVNQQSELVLNSKGLISLENFLIARHNMYRQVYFHRTNLTCETMLQKIWQRVKYLWLHHNFKDFLYWNFDDLFLFAENQFTATILETFCNLDDIAVLSLIKYWTQSNDVILSQLCQRLLQRNLFKSTLQQKPFFDHFEAQTSTKICTDFNISPQEVSFFFEVRKIEIKFYQKQYQPILIQQPEPHNIIEEFSTISTQCQSYMATNVKYFGCYIQK